MNIKHQADTLLRKITSVFSIITIIIASSVGFSNSANAVDVAAGGIVSSTNVDGAGGGAFVAGAGYVFVGATGSFNTAVALVIGDLSSTTADTALSITGAGGLTVNDIRATDALAITVADLSKLTVGGGTITDQPLSIALTGTAQLVFTDTDGGGEIQTAIITATGDGDGVITSTGATTYNGLIGATDDDIGSLNITSSSGIVTVNAVSFIKTVNVGANTNFLRDVNADVINITGATTTLTLGDKFLAATAETTAVATMTATGQKIILDGEDVISGNLVSATDGFGEVEITGAATIAGDIGTSTTLKVGLVDINENVSIQKNVFTDATTIAANKTLTIGGAVVDLIYTGTINGDTDADGGIGNITINNAAAAANAITFTGAIGATGEIDMITLTTEANFSSDVKADGVTIAAATVGKFAGNLTLGGADLTLGDATSQATFNGTSGQTISGGAAGEEIDGTGIIQISNTSSGGVTFGANATIDSATVQLKLAADARATTSVVGHVVKDITTLAGSVLKLDDTIANTNTIFTTTDTLTADSIHASSFIKMPSNFDNGETIKLFVDVLDAGAAAIALDANSALVDTGLVNYVATVTDTDDITVTATETTDVEAATTLSVTTDDAKALRQVRAAMLGTASGIDQLSNILSMENGITAAGRKSFVEQAAPQDDLITGSTFATKAMTGTVQGIVSSRMASLRSGDAYVSGVATGNHMSANSMFLEAFGSMSEQDNKRVGSGTQFGYEADTAGLAIGADGLLSNGSVLGLSLSMSNTDVDGKGTGRAKNDIDSYTASLYMDKATAAGYIEGSLTYGINENSSSRLVNTDGTNATYSADYDSDQISLKIGGGIPNNIGDNTFITPFGSLTATKISTDAYTERSTTAGDNLRLRVAQDDVDSYVGTIGIKAHKVTDQGTPMISLAINNEFGDNTISSTNTYQGGGTAFKTSTDVEELSATLALGYKFGSDKLSFTLGYEATANDDDYLSHYGSAKLVSKF